MSKERRGKPRRFEGATVHSVTHQHVHMAGGRRFGAGPEVILSTTDVDTGGVAYVVYWRVRASEWYIARTLTAQQFAEWDGGGYLPVPVHYRNLRNWLSDVSKGGTGRDRHPID